MLALRSLAIGLAGAAILIVSCQRESPGLGPPPNCPADACQPSAVAGQGATGAGGGAGGAATGSLTGSVALLTDATFGAQATPYDGAATIIAGQVEFAYTSAATGFDLEGLVVGQQWVFVDDQTDGASGILSTFSLQQVSATDITLPVIDAQVMSKIASGLPMPTTISKSAAQIILFLDHGTTPFVGVSVAAGGPGGVIAYDEGQGIYSNQATATGAAGAIVILNAPALTGSVAITLVDSASNQYSLGDIPATAGAATIAGFTL